MKLYTKGPWAAQLHHPVRMGGRTYAMITSMTAPAIVPVGSVVLGVEGCSQQEGRANAHLIAAAPELDAAAGMAITALSFAAERYQQDGDAIAFAQTIAAKEALIAAQNKALGVRPQMRDVTPQRKATSRLLIINPGSGYTEQKP